MMFTSHLPVLVHLFDKRLLLTVDEVAQVLGCSVSSIYKLSHAKKMPFAVVNDMGLRVSVVELASYLDAQLSKSVDLSEVPLKQTVVDSGGVVEQSVVEQPVNARRGGRPRGRKVDSVIGR